MTSESTPDPSLEESGVARSALSDPPVPPEPPGWSGLLARPWFWILAIGTLWGLPLIKNLGREYPDPVPGWEREPERLELVDEAGRAVSTEALAGHILIVQALDLSSAQQAEDSFDGFRLRKKRLRGLGSLVVHVLLVKNGTPETLGALLDEKVGRKPNNVYLFDPGGETWATLIDRALSPGAVALVLDRHGRLRGSYGSNESEGNRMSQELASLANWPGSDPELGAPVSR